MNAAARIFNDRNRLWSLPVLAGLAALTFFAVRGSHQPAIRGAAEAAIAMGIGFVLTAGWTLISDWLVNRTRIPSRAEQAADIELAHAQIGNLRGAIRLIEVGLREYLEAKKAEGLKIQDAILDLNNDVALIKDKDPTSMLRNQLSMIADKFGELAGIRAVVGHLSNKVKRVEAMADLLLQAEQSADDAVDSPALDARLEALRDELRAEFGQNIFKPGTDAAARAEEMLATIRNDFEARIAAGVADLLAKTDAGEIARIADAKNTERFEAMERRLVKISKTIETMQEHMENLRWSGGDDGIPSIYRGVQGVNAGDPNKGIKSGCLAKIFQANLALRKAIAA